MYRVTWCIGGKLKQVSWSGWNVYNAAGILMLRDIFMIDSDCDYDGTCRSSVNGFLKTEL